MQPPKGHKNSYTAIIIDGTPIRFRSFLGTTTRTATPLRWLEPLSISLSCNRKIIAANCWIVGKHRAPSAGNSGGGAFVFVVITRFIFHFVPGRKNEIWNMWCWNIGGIALIVWICYISRGEKWDITMDSLKSSPLRGAFNKIYIISVSKNANFAM